MREGQHLGHGAGTGDSGKVGRAMSSQYDEVGLLGSVLVEQFLCRIAERYSCLHSNLALFCLEACYRAVALLCHSVTPVLLKPRGSCIWSVSLGSVWCRLHAAGCHPSTGIDHLHSSYCAEVAF